MDDANTPSSKNGTPHDSSESVEALRKRISELETALEKMTRQREETRRMLFELYAVAFPNNPPPSEEELIEEFKTRTEISITEMIAELEREVGAA